MVLATVSIKVEPDKWDLFIKLYPQKGSKLIRDFIHTLIKNTSDIAEDTTAEQLADIIDQHLLASNNERVKADALKARLEELRTKSEEEVQTLLVNKELLEEEFRAECSDSNFYHKFRHKYVMSGAKDRGISEFDFFKELREEQHEENN